MRKKSVAVGVLMLCASVASPAVAQDMMSHVDMNSPAMTMAEMTRA